MCVCVRVRVQDSFGHRQWGSHHNLGHFSCGCRIAGTEARQHKQRSIFFHMSIHIYAYIYGFVFGSFTFLFPSGGSSPPPPAAQSPSAPFCVGRPPTPLCRFGSLRTFWICAFPATCSHIFSCVLNYSSVFCQKASFQSVSVPPQFLPNFLTKTKPNASKPSQGGQAVPQKINLPDVPSRPQTNPRQSTTRNPTLNNSK